MNTKQLKAKCKALEIPNYENLTKDKLIEVITMALSETTPENVNTTASQEDSSDVVTPTLTKEVKEDTVAPTAMVKYEKLIKGAFGFLGNDHKGNFELSKKDSEHRKIKNAIESGIIRIKK
jgi:hypothetical protein